MIITSGEITKATGKPTFDGIIVNRDWAKQHADFMVKYLKAHRGVRRELSSQHGEVDARFAKVKAVAKIERRQAAGRAGRPGRCIASRPRRSRRPRHGSAAADSGAAQSLAATSAFLKEQGTIQNVMPDYSVGINPKFVQDAAK